MKKKGAANKLKKRVRRLPKRKVTRKWGYIPKYRHFCIICKEIDGTINQKDLTVHHHKQRSDRGGDRLTNLEVICEEHHRQLHSCRGFTKIKEIYETCRKGKFNKIQTT